MARRSVAISTWIASLIVGGAILGPVILVVTAADGWGAWGVRDSEALWFSIWQASLSALLSAIGGVAFAWALFRSRFYGRAALMTLVGAPFLLSVLVAILGLVLVFGPKGMVAHMLPIPKLYGPYGVILAHVFFNLPLATRVFYHGFTALPAEQFRLAQSLGFGSFKTLSIATLPMLQRTGPAVISVIFLICLGSFTVPLTLGGGPQSTTLELSIYQAFRFDFDLGRAARLALTQAGLGLLFTCVLWLLGGHMLDRGGAKRVQGVLYRSLPAKLWDGGVIVVCSLFLLAPLMAATLRGVQSLEALPPAVWGATATSLYVALGATVVTMVLAFGLMQSRMGSWVALLSLSISPIVLGLGAYLGLRPFVLPRDWGLEVTMLSNGLVALPFAVSILHPRYHDLAQRYERLRVVNAMTAAQWWITVILPAMAPTVGFAIGVTLALSMGDLGVILLFSDPQTPTLPQMVYALMGQYKMDAALSTAIWMMAVSFALFAAATKIGERYARL